MKTAIALLLAIVSGAASAQTAQNEKLNEVTSKLRACVRARAPAAQAAGIKTNGDAVNFFIKACSPPLEVRAFTDPDYYTGGAIPPGIFRRVVTDEWVKFKEEEPSGHHRNL